MYAGALAEEEEITLKKDKRRFIALLTVAVLLLAAGAVAYVTSRLTIRFLMAFTGRHGFVPFGIYRIVLGCAVRCYYLF